MKKAKILLTCLTILLLCISCDKHEPDSLTPVITLEDATNIDITSASVKVSVVNNGGTIQTCTLFVSTSSNFDTNVKELTLTLSNGTATAIITDLTPETEYFYKLKISSGASTVYSEVKKFTTLAIALPTIESLNVALKGNQMTCQFTANPGKYTLTGIFLSYQSQYDAQPISQSLALNSSSKYEYSVKNLHPKTTYNISVYAANSYGKGNVSTISFATDSLVYLDKAGTLPNVIAEGQKYLLTTLKIVGPINGTDIGYLHEMGGVANYGGNVLTSGKLATLDLSDATIESGGNGVNHWDVLWYSETNTITRRFLDGTTSIRTITIPSSVTKIVGGGINADCALESIIVPENNPYFSSADGLLYNKNKTLLIALPPIKKSNALTIPNSVTELGDLSLWGVSYVKQLTLPNTLKKLGAEAFCGYQNISSELGELTIPSSVTSVATQQFYGAHLKGIKFLATISVLPFGTFQYCNQLESVTLSSSITEIEEMAFERCNSLKEVHCLSSTPPTVISTSENPAFKGTDKTTCVIYVPKGSLSAYKSAAIWSTFTHIVEE